MTQRQVDNINGYLTWGNVWKAITVICACGWFMFNLLRDNTVRDMRIDQTQKDIADIKAIAIAIRNDAKENNDRTDSRIKQLEVRVTILENNKPKP
jgi:hypothetical protein